MQIDFSARISNSEFLLALTTESFVARQLTVDVVCCQATAGSLRLLQTLPVTLSCFKLLYPPISSLTKTMQVFTRACRTCSQCSVTFTLISLEFVRSFVALVVISKKLMVHLMKYGTDVQHMCRMSRLVCFLIIIIIIIINGIYKALFTNRPGALTKLATICSTEQFSFKTAFKQTGVTDLMKVGWMLMLSTSIKGITHYALYKFMTYFLT